jgi:phosphoglycolate phosphatase
VRVGHEPGGRLMPGERPAGGFQAVLFDLDGTLLDSLEDLADSMNAVLRSSGFPAHPLAAYRRYVGDGMELLVRRALPEDARDEETVRFALAGMREEYGRRHVEKTRPYLGVPELLDELAGRGFPMAILSNKPDVPTKLIVRKLLGSWPFQAVLGARPWAPKKPDPSGALEVSEALKIAPSHFLYVGDTDTDMRTASAAGMWGLGALWGFRDAQELTAAGAKALLASPEELLDYLPHRPPRPQPVRRP